jgi:hypothetical protein
MTEGVTKGMFCVDCNEAIGSAAALSEQDGHRRGHFQGAGARTQAPEGLSRSAMIRTIIKRYLRERES